MDLDEIATKCKNVVCNFFLLYFRKYVNVASNCRSLVCRFGVLNTVYVFSTGMNGI